MGRALRCAVSVGCYIMVFAAVGLQPPQLQHLTLCRHGDRGYLRRRFVGGIPLEGGSVLVS